MSVFQTLIDVFTQVPRDEPLGRICVVPQGQELPTATIDRLHSDEPLTKLDKQQLRQWAAVHGYDPELLADDKRLRLLTDCEHPAHRPISEHWQVECNDEGVTVPETIGRWQQVDTADYWIPVEWQYNGETVRIQGLYGQWTVTANREPIATEVPATEAVQAAWNYMTAPVTPEQPAATDAETGISDQFWQNLQQMAKTEADPADAPAWFDAFPEQIGDFERTATVYVDAPAQLTYGRTRPGERRQADMVRIVHENGLFIAREQVEVNGRLRWQDTPESVLFQRLDATAAASTVVQYLRDGRAPRREPAPQPNVPWPREEMFQEDIRRGSP